jgi:hypothetical protein
MVFYGMDADVCKTQKPEATASVVDTSTQR